MTLLEAAKALLALYDKKRQIEPWLAGGVFVDAVHAAECRPGLCLCGGFEHKHEVRAAIEKLREVAG